MEESKLSIQQQQKLQMLFNKANTAYERGNFDIALDLLKVCLQTEPGSLRNRRLYHQARMRKFKQEKRGGLGLKMAELKGELTVGKVRSLIKAENYNEALELAETLLDINPTNSKFNEVYFEAAQRSDYPEALLAAMEILHDNCPDDLNLLMKMGKAYMEAEVYDKARDCFQQIAAARPNDLSIQKLIKDAEARNTMTAGGWEENAGKQGGFQQLIRDKEVAKKLDQQNKAVVSGDDAEAMIKEYKAKIAKEPKNINFYRALARVYSQNKRFEEALEALRGAKVVNPADPELDRMLSATRIQAFDSDIAALRAEGKTDEADALEVEKNQFSFDDLVTRVEQYPNDLRLRYELGVMYYTYEAYDDAIQQFQLSQRSPKDRLESLYYLACCFKEKGKPDMAIMQLETANSQLLVMDDLKKRVMYTLGVINEEGQQYDKAFNYYKEVYAADIGFKDIGERMERVYKLRTEA